MRRRLASSTSTSITIQRITIVTLVAGWQKAPRHEALQPLEAETARAFWGMYSASANSAGETQDGPERQVAQANVAPASFFRGSHAETGKEYVGRCGELRESFHGFSQGAKGETVSPGDPENVLCDRRYLVPHPGKTDCQDMDACAVSGILGAGTQTPAYQCSGGTRSRGALGADVAGRAGVTPPPARHGTMKPDHGPTRYGYIVQSFRLFYPLGV